MICKIKLEPGARMPVKNHPKDSCYDIFCNEDFVVNGFQTGLLRTGIKIAPEPGWGIDIEPRSGRSMSGIILGGGIIDNIYRGEIGVIIHNFLNEKLVINKGEKIAQIRPIRIEDIDFIQVQELPDSDRGSNGFGSSGNY